MAKTIKKHWDIALTIGIGLCLVIVAILAVSDIESVPFAFATDATSATTVQVTATITGTIEITVTTTSMDLGTLTDSAVASTTNNFTVKTNTVNGYTVTLKGTGDDTNGGLEGTSTSYLITSTAATLAAGTEGYGAQGVDVSGMTIDAAYDYSATTTVGQVSTTAVTLATQSSDGATYGEQATLTLMAAITTITGADVYYDTLTLTATGTY